ncbi:MAG: amidase family protein, partial [Nanoarchaeota archaeon]
VSRYGVIAMGSSLDSIGAVAYSVEDLTHLAEIMSGKDEHDSTTSPQAVPEYHKNLSADVKGLKIGIPKQYFVDANKFKTLIDLNCPNCGVDDYLKDEVNFTAETYYKDQLNLIEVGKTEYAPTFKIFANGNGQDTKNISLNADSAKELIKWLTDNFIDKEPKTYIDNGKFIELVSEIATELTQTEFKDKTFQQLEDGETFTDEAQDFYIEKYDSIEALINETTGIYSDEDKNDISE